MVRVRHAALALLLCVFCGQAVAAPSADQPFEPGARIRQIIKMVKRFFVLVGQDEPQPPPPKP
jgi:hypothetical protein